MRIGAKEHHATPSQVTRLYSQRLAEAGYICLAFDAAYQEAIDGEPRNTDKPPYRIEKLFLNSFSVLHSHLPL